MVNNVGADNTEKCPDFYVNVTENGKTYQYLLNNPEFTAYLKIVKKDSKTHQTVLKKGTTYQIYKVDKEGNETLVTQKYSNGNKMVVVDRFVTDETGEIITYEKLKAGTYKVYEIEGPEGYKVNKSPVTVEINSDSYKTMKDELGNEYLYAECEYYNDVTYGKFTLDKTGPELCGRNDESSAEANETTDKPESKADMVSENETGASGSNDKTIEVKVNPFDYDDVKLNGVVFELTAKRRYHVTGQSGNSAF